MVVDPAAFAWLCRLGALGLCVLWVFTAHVLGWTDQLIGSVQGGSAWTQRDVYAGQGLESMRHLSVVNIAKAVMVVPLLVVLAYAIGWPRRIHALGETARYLFVGTLVVTGIFSYLNRDIPFNFYGARYYLPIVLPLLMLSFGLVLSTWPRQLGRLALAGVVLAAGYWTYGLVAVPAYGGNLAFLGDVARRAQGSDVIFLVADPSLARSTQLGLMGLSSRPVVFIDEQRLGQGEGRALVDAYLEALGAEHASLVSRRRLPFGGEAVRVRVATSIIPFRIAYNTYERHEVTTDLYVSGYRDDSLVLRHASPQWTVGGTLRVPLSRPQGPRDRFVVLRTGGGWSWAHQRGGIAPALEVSIDGRPAPLHRVVGGDYYFAVPAGVPASESLEVRSSTFVPAQVGINADQRALGIDLVSVRFVPEVD